LAAQLQLQIIVLLWGCTAILGRQISIQAIPLVFYRLVIVVAVLAIYVPARGISLRLTAGKALRYAAVGALIGLHWLCFYGAIKVAGIATAVLSLSTATFFTAVCEPIVFRRRVAGSELAIGAVVVAAASLLIQYELHATPLGLALGLGSALLAAVFGVLNGKLAHEQPERLMFYELTAALVVVSVFVPWQLVVPPAADVGWLAILAIACTVVPQIWIIYVLRQLSPFTVSVTVNLEPVYALILAAVIFGETLSPQFYAGAGVLFALVIVNGLRRAVRQGNVAPVARRPGDTTIR
jgi:drug/metabolite transporter (DMT)-like permease